jgi:tRNA pseudouridine38-40 synthase
MVRNLAGTLLEAGKGNLDAAAIRAVIASRDRARCGPTVPAKGLFLTGVEYPDAVMAGKPGRRARVPDGRR